MRRITSRSSGLQPRPIVFVVEDEPDLRGGMRRVLDFDDRAIADFASAEDFLEAYKPVEVACLLLDTFMPGMGGMALLQHLQALGHDLPVVMITGRGDVPLAVEAMRRGAFDFIEKPVAIEKLIAVVELALAESRRLRAARDDHAAAVADFASLTSRQGQILRRILAGTANKIIAVELGISQRTVENHRAAIMAKTRAGSVAELTRMAIAARWTGIETKALSKAREWS